MSVPIIDISTQHPEISEGDQENGGGTQRPIWASSLGERQAPKCPQSGGTHASGHDTGDDRVIFWNQGLIQLHIQGVDHHRSMMEEAVREAPD